MLNIQIDKKIKYRINTLGLCTVQFLYLETYGLRKWGKTKEDGGIGYEASTCFMAQDVSEDYQSKIRWPLEH
jgi:hypothetical protein